MKRSMQLLLALCMTLATSNLSLYGVLQSRLPNNFYIFDQNSSTPVTQNLISETPIPRAFIIIVGAQTTLPSKSPEVYGQLQQLFKSVTLPQGLLPAINSDSRFLTLYFDWEDKVGFKNIREYGAIFGKGITELVTKYNAVPIIITLGRGGLMVNFASNQWQTGIATLPLLIQIGTPIPPKEEVYADLFPKAQNLRRLFHFYSTQPFVTDQPTLHPPYQASYDTLLIPSAYNFIVLLNNNQPLQHKLLTLSSLTNNVLHFCAQAQNNFLANKQLFLSLSPRQEETNGLIGIAQPNTKITSEQNKAELAYNNQILTTFTQAWSYGPRLTIPSGEYLRNSYKFHDE